MSRFTGKKVLVTGGNSGMGYDTAKLFVQEGADVFITGRDEATLKQAVKELGPNSRYVVSNAGDLKQITALAQKIESEFGHLDAAFINAGIATFASLDEINEEHFDSVFDTNIKGPLFLVQKIAPLFKNGGSIVLNGSIVAHMGFPNSVVYSASKAAMVNLAKTLSTELLSKNIRVNVLSPGPIETPIFKRPGSPMDDAAIDHMRSLVPLQRLGKGEEIARSVLFLASQDSSFILGTELIIDGGMSQL